MQEYVKKNEEHFSHLSEEECDALEVFTGMKQLDHKMREKYRNRKGEDYNMCTAFVEMVEEGKKEGLEEGIRKGRNEGIKEGLKEGETMLTRLAWAMRADGREAEFFDCCINEALRRRLLQEYGIREKEQ